MNYLIEEFEEIEKKIINKENITKEKDLINYLFKTIGAIEYKVGNKNESMKEEIEELKRIKIKKQKELDTISYKRIKLPIIKTKINRLNSKRTRVLFDIFIIRNLIECMGKKRRNKKRII